MSSTDLSFDRLWWGQLPGGGSRGFAPVGAGVVKFSWPRRASGLPPGQRLLDRMPRFGDLPHRPPPPVATEVRVEVRVEGESVAVITDAELQKLGPRTVEADFHCVTTWSVRGLAWRGVPLAEVLAALGIVDAPASYLVGRSADRRRVGFLSQDALAPDVLLATHVDGQPLGSRHGGPVRLVAPRQYGYKSIKHLTSLDFRAQPPRLMSKEHLRARVALEERHPRWPSWMVKLPYRLLIPPTALIAERSLRRFEADSSG